MRMKCIKSTMEDGNSFFSSRSELAILVAVAESVAKLAPQGITLSDEVLFENGEFKFGWIHARDGRKAEVERVRAFENGIMEGLTHCQARRMDAIKNNRAIHELPTDAKLLAMNKSMFEARAKECLLHLDEDHGSIPLPAVDPRDLLLQVPRAEPREVEANFLVSGSNVVGGAVQLELLEETMVDVVYFIQGGPYQQIRATVPLRLANVRNLVTRVRVKCSLHHPGDTFLTAMGAPYLYQIVDGVEIPF